MDDFDELNKFVNVLKIEHSLISHFNFYLDKNNLKDNITLYSSIRRTYVFNYCFNIIPTLYCLYFTNFHSYIDWEIDDQYGNILKCNKIQNLNELDKEIIDLIKYIKGLINE